MSRKLDLLFLFLAIFSSGTIFSLVATDPVEDKQALLDFLQNMPHSPYINWNENASVCANWTGVYCNVDHSRVIALRLPAAGLYGPIPPNTLSRLSAMQILSLRLNTIFGPFPSDFSKLLNLTAIYLQFNQFSGPLPSDFSVWKNLTTIDFSNNSFNGSIPSSISNLTHLTSLNLANNLLSGAIPDLNIPSLQQLSLANNSLNGSVPESLQRFPSSAFSGNNLTTENASPPAFPVQPPSAQTSDKGTKLSESAILGIAIGGIVLVFVLIAIFMMFCSEYGIGKEVDQKNQKKKEVVLKKGVSHSREQDKDEKLVFFEGNNLAFDLEDLLRSSAEVLGKGAFGTTYKAALDDGNTVVVKRLKEVSVGQREFEQQMEVVGSIRHENVVALRAYYYSKDEKLAVYDFYNRGSVSAMLHGMFFFFFLVSSHYPESDV